MKITFIIIILHVKIMSPSLHIISYEMLYRESSQLLEAIFPPIRLGNRSKEMATVADIPISGF